MRKISTCLLLALVMSYLFCTAMAEEFFIIRNGVRFGCSVDEVRAAEGAAGLDNTADELTDGKIEYSNVEIDGATIPIKLTYRFANEELCSVEYDITANRTFADLYESQDDIWIDADAALADAVKDEYWDRTVGAGYNGASINEEALIHPDTPDDLKTDMIWGIFRATGQDPTGSFSGYPLEVEDLIIFIYGQVEFEVGEDNILMTSAITATQSGDAVRMILRFDSI